MTETIERSNAAAQAPLTAAQELELRDFSKSTALVIDPAQLSRGILTQQLREFGVGRVVQCAKLSEARVALEQREFDFVICEQHFDNEALAGQALLDDLRREAIIPFTTVFIMLTSAATAGDVTEAAEAALDGFLVKPHKASALFDRVLTARRRKLVLAPIFKAIEAQDFERAARMCMERYEKRQDFWLFSARIGAELMLRLKRLPETVELYKAILNAKTTPWAKLGIARSQLEMGQPMAAIATLEELVQGNTNYADAFDVMAHAHIETGNMEQALDCYEMSLRSTPGSVLRAQKKAMVSFYLGHDEDARADLLKVSQRAAGSKLFDHQSLMVLAFTSFRSKKSGDLTWCSKVMQNAAAGQPQSVRLDRMSKVVSALVAFNEGRDSDGLKPLLALAGMRHDTDFDFEAACNLVTTISTLTARGIVMATSESVITDIGMRFCGTNGATEMLTRAAWVHPAHVEVLRGAHAQVLKLAQAALKHSIQGDPATAVKSLIAKGEELQNHKLVESARLTLMRHWDRIEDAAALQERISKLSRQAGSMSVKPGARGEVSTGSSLLRLRQAEQ